MCVHRLLCFFLCKKILHETGYHILPYHFFSMFMHLLECFSFLGCHSRYEQAEFIEREMEQMTEQIKSIIQTLNTNQVRIFSSMIHFFPEASFTDNTFDCFSFSYRVENLM